MRHIVLSLLLISPTLHASLDEATNAWWSRVQILADDNMEGRLTGSDGYLRAARYVASQFEQLGLRPAGSEGYYQRIDFESRKVNEEKSFLHIIRDGKAIKVPLGIDASINASRDAARSFLSCRGRSTQWSQRS